MSLWRDKQSEELGRPAAPRSGLPALGDLVANKIRTDPCVALARQVVFHRALAEVLEAIRCAVVAGLDRIEVQIDPERCDDLEDELLNRMNFTVLRKMAKGSQNLDRSVLVVALARAWRDQP